MSQISPLILASLPPTAQINYETLKQRLAAYVQQMKPGVPVSSETGVTHQMLLWSSLKTMLNLDGSEFIAHYSYILQVIHENRKTCFSERYVFRFFDQLRLSSADLRVFQGLLHLMMATADPQTRPLALKQLSLATVLSGVVNEDARQRVIGYYSL